MKFKYGISKFYYTFISIVFAAVLLAGSLFTYWMLNQNMKTDIFSLSREIQYKIFRTATNEYQNYYFLIQSLNNFHPETVMTESGLRAQMEGVFSLYGPKGRTPGMISDAGYFYRDHPEYIYLFDGTDNGWRKSENTLETDLSNRQMMLLPVKDSSGRDQFYIFYQMDSSEDIVLTFRLDDENFFETYIKPAVNYALGEYELTWTEYEDPEVQRLLSNSDRSDIRNLHFNPFTAFFNKNLDGANPVIMPIPGFMDAIRFFRDSDRHPSEKDEPEIDFKPPDFNDLPKSDSFYKTSHLILIRHPKGPFYFEVELKTAINFFKSIIVLIGTGAFFYLTVFQAERLRRLRVKEKEFVASITHELRTPLTVIKSAADNLSTGIIPEDRIEKYGRVIKQQSERLSTMIEEMLLFANLEAKGNNSTKTVHTDMRGLLENLRHPLDMLASSRGITIVWDIENLLKLSCNCDPETISLVLENVIANALNHAFPDKPGEIRITGKIKIPESLEFAVEDNGRGIEPRELKYIFNPFYRDSISRQRQEKGSGLGLFISKRKTDMAGGTLKVESPYRRIDGKKQNGCRFTISFPCRKVETTA